MLFAVYVGTLKTFYNPSATKIKTNLYNKRIYKKPLPRKGKIGKNDVRSCPYLKKKLGASKTIFPLIIITSLFYIYIYKEISYYYYPLAKIVCRPKQVQYRGVKTLILGTVAALGSVSCNSHRVVARSTARLSQPLGLSPCKGSVRVSQWAYRTRQRDSR